MQTFNSTNDFPVAIECPSPSEADAHVPVTAAGHGSNPALMDALVMIVDDEPINAEVVQVYLEGSGFKRFITCSDSTKALAMVMVHQPDVLLTDLNMPGLSGLELLKIVRQRFPHLPVILMTGEGNDAVVAEALQNGAASYVAKDKSMGALLETIDRIVGAFRPPGV